MGPMNSFKPQLTRAFKHTFLLYIITELQLFSTTELEQLATQKIEQKKKTRIPQLTNSTFGPRPSKIL